MKISKLLLLFMLGLSVITSCSDDDDPPTPDPMTISEIVQGDTDFSTLLTALERANLTSVLSGSDEYTVFAPTNAAFTAFLSDNGFSGLDDIPDEVLRQTLLNHVVSGDNRASSLSTGYISTSAVESTTSENVSMYVDVNGGNVTLNGESNVTKADVAASNGVVHVVNKVIALPNIVTFALSNPSFSNLVEAVTRPSFGDTYTSLLSGSAGGPFTVFAPTDAAFASLLSALKLSSLDDISDDVLKTVLNYHVIAGANVRSSALTDGGTAETFLGDILTFDLSSGAAVADATGSKANVVAADVQAYNGVIHAVDKVLIPQAVWDAVNPTIALFVAGNDNYSSLLAAVQKAGLAEVLASDDSNLTVLAPDNAAFAAFLSAAGFSSLDDVPVDVLKNVLLNHVIGGKVNRADIATGYASTLATNADGDNLSIYINDGSDGVSFNGGAKVTAPDLRVRNGVIHAIDQVIGLPTVVDFALADPTFGILVAALTRDDNTTDFVGVLSSTGAPSPFTVFAPTDGAFVDLLTELELSGLEDVPQATLDAVLKYHVFPGANVRAEDLTDGMMVSMLGGADITISLPSDASPYITDQRGRQSNIIVTDVQAINGVIHALDKVILP